MKPALSRFLNAVQYYPGGCRRRQYWASWIMFLCIIPPTLAESPTTPKNWPRFLNSDFDGSTELSADASSKLASLNWAASPRCIWSIEVGDGYGLGVVRDGAYFHFDAADGRERVSKINLSDGQQQWQQSSPLNYRDLYGYETGPRCSPTIDGDQIFTFGVAGELIARGVSSGTEHWKVATNATYGVVQNFFWRRILAVGPWGNCHCDDWR